MPSPGLNSRNWKVSNWSVLKIQPNQAVMTRLSSRMLVDPRCGLVSMILKQTIQFFAVEMASLGRRSQKYLTNGETVTHGLVIMRLICLQKTCQLGRSDWDAGEKLKIAIC